MKALFLILLMNHEKDFKLHVLSNTFTALILERKEVERKNLSADSLA